MSDNQIIYKATTKIVHSLDARREFSSGKADLANLRKSIGKELSSSVGIWPLIYESVPVNYLSPDGQATSQEQAIIDTLRFYALLQQGVHGSIVQQSDSKKHNNIGAVLKVLRNKDNQTSIDRRFNVLITSATYQEFVYHLRMMFNLLRSRIKGDYYIDFGRLAQDLYWYHRGYPESIRLNWARSYYSFTQEKEKVDYET